MIADTAGLIIDILGVLSLVGSVFFVCLVVSGERRARRAPRVVERPLPSGVVDLRQYRADWPTDGAA